MARVAPLHRLYKGFEAEWLVAGKLFGCGLDAYKLLADRGIDLMVMRHHHLAGKDSTPRIAFPYYLQVKSLRANEKPVGQLGRRPETLFPFWIKIDEIALLEGRPDHFLVLTMKLPDLVIGAGERWIYAWLCGEHLPQLYKLGYLRAVSDHPDMMELKIKCTWPEKGSLDRVIKECELRNVPLGFKQQQILGRLLPPGEYDVRGTLYVSLCGHRNAKRLLDPMNLDLSKLGAFSNSPFHDGWP